MHVLSGTGVVPSATVTVSEGADTHHGSGCGDGPVAAVLRAIDDAVGARGSLVNYMTRAATPGRDALGEVSVTLEYEQRQVVGKGYSTDIVEAGARAYVAALNRTFDDPAIHAQYRGEPVRTRHQEVPR